MTEPAGSAGQASPADGGQTAGAILRAAREGRGLHIAALAASIKVSPRKLDALEGDRLDELPDATFARALAQAVCRALKVDPQPVLAKMPAAESAASSLERHRAGLNAPFEEVSGRSATAIRSSHKAMLAAGLLLVVSAAGILLLPPGFLRREQPLPSSISAPQASQSAPAGSGAAPAPALPVAFAPSAAVAASAVAVFAKDDAVETIHSAPPGLGPAAEPPPMLLLAVSEPSWVEVQDRAARVLLSRTLAPGEAVRAYGDAPLRVRIGNAAATQLEFRGRPVDLMAVARNNVVSELELK